VNHRPFALARFFSKLLELVGRQVVVIVANTPGVLAVKAAITTTPIVFTTASDPVQIGLVASMSRPGGNVTGATALAVELAPKRLELAHELVPTALRKSGGPKCCDA
jgi:ABC-type uncharacterized transport system substrate-binding protein